MPGNDQSFDIDAYLCYIFGEENELEQVGEQELHRMMKALLGNVVISKKNPTHTQDHGDA